MTLAATVLDPDARPRADAPALGPERAGADGRGPRGARRRRRRARRDPGGHGRADRVGRPGPVLRQPEGAAARRAPPARGARRRRAGEIVCYLADDDLWLPGHVEEMQAAARARPTSHTRSRSGSTATASSHHLRRRPRPSLLPRAAAGRREPHPALVRRPHDGALPAAAGRLAHDSRRAPSPTCTCGSRSSPCPGCAAVSGTTPTVAPLPQLRPRAAGARSGGSRSSTPGRTRCRRSASGCSTRWRRRARASEELLADTRGRAPEGLRGLRRGGSRPRAALAARSTARRPGSRRWTTRARRAASRELAYLSSSVTWRLRGAHRARCPAWARCSDGLRRL